MEGPNMEKHFSKKDLKDDFRDQIGFEDKIKSYTNNGGSREFAEYFIVNESDTPIVKEMKNKCFESKYKNGYSEDLCKQWIDLIPYLSDEDQTMVFENLESLTHEHHGIITGVIEAIKNDDANKLFPSILEVRDEVFMIPGSTRGIVESLAYRHFNGKFDNLSSESVFEIINFLIDYIDTALKHDIVNTFETIESIGLLEKIKGHLDDEQRSFLKAVVENENSEEVKEKIASLLNG